jgi:thioredoxin-related protein
MKNMFVVILAVFLVACEKNEKTEPLSKQLGFSNSSVKQKELYDLYKLAQQSKQKKLPIMLTFVAQWCDFCHLLASEVLDPMALGKLYERKYMFARYISIDDPKPILGIYNKTIIKSKLAAKYNVDITPTVVFIDSTGKQVAPPIIGVANIEMYTILIHKALNIAYKNMNNGMEIPPFVEDLVKITDN